MRSHINSYEIGNYSVVGIYKNDLKLIMTPAELFYLIGVGFVVLFSSCPFDVNVLD